LFINKVGLPEILPFEIQEKLFRMMYLLLSPTKLTVFIARI